MDVSIVSVNFYDGRRFLFKSIAYFVFSFGGYHKHSVIFVTLFVLSPSSGDLSRYLALT